MFKKIKIYGSDTNIRVNGATKVYPTSAEVLALSDIVTFELDTKGIYAQLEINTEKKTFWNGSELHINMVRNAYNPQSAPIKFPNTNVTIENFYGAKVLKKRYKWLDISDYPIRPEGIVTNGLIAINITGYSLSDNDNGTKSIAFNIAERGI